MKTASTTNANSTPIAASSDQTIEKPAPIRPEPESPPIADRPPKIPRRMPHTTREPRIQIRPARMNVPPFCVNLFQPYVSASPSGAVEDGAVWSAGPGGGYPPGGGG